MRSGRLHGNSRESSGGRKLQKGPSATPGNYKYRKIRGAWGRFSRTLERWRVFKRGDTASKDRCHEGKEFYGRDYQEKTVDAAAALESRINVACGVGHSSHVPLNQRLVGGPDEKERAKGAQKDEGENINWNKRARPQERVAMPLKGQAGHARRGTKHKGARGAKKPQRKKEKKRKK